ncbi:FAD-containing oxidoreductase [Desulfopila sp. IMCC35006]|uniref:FAD-containing oxidoreductase n=1 Tax=Desulfopila sp. IMCC35006 TaxID=2569542 RepID=UPI0010AB7944|nr:FAD-containing oxidoreductase [Desulfopila sp. IMCC35006]TKB28381.1 FAD-containing oxidoreductase [Desulfopila sp. IMCC35006]
MSKNNSDDDQVSLQGTDLDELRSSFRAIVDIRDRQYGFPPKNYASCFVGSEAVGKLIEQGLAADEDDAVRLGNVMLHNGIFHHVQRAHAFKNEYLFYRFASDEDHGGVPDEVADGSAVKWSDFLGSLTSLKDSDRSLQPSLPEPDAELGNMDQIDLEAIGVSPLDAHNAKLLDNVHPKKWLDPEPKSSYNLVVIGAGAGGLVSAAGAAGVGARVALIESHLLGGDCLNVGCVPSKALLRCAKAVAAVRDAGQFGVRIEGGISVDFGYVMERMRRLRAQISPVDSARRYSDQLGVDVFMGRGVFTGKKSIEVNGKTLNFAKAVIATGGTAAIPKIPGLTDVPFLTNNSVFNLTELPKRFGVIGAGPIGLELAQAFQRLGSRVTVFSRNEHILAKEDPEAVQIVKEAMEKDGVSFVFNARYRCVEKGGENGPLRVVLAEEGTEKVFEFDALLVATGRKPSVTGLGLEKAGVEFDVRKGVVVNDRLQTTNPDIFAVGDVASRYQFTHMADFMARLVIKNALFFGRDKVSDLLIPWATYTDPEVAHVGLYEKDLQERKIPFVTFKRALSDVDRGIVDGVASGYVKIHVAKGKDQILGATIVGSHAGDMISEITVAMQGGMGLGRLAGVIHPYPTAAEAIRQCGDAYNRERLTPTVKSIFHNFMALRR